MNSAYTFGGTIAMDANATASLHKMGVPTTNDHRKFIWFQDHESTIKAIYCGTEFLESAEAGKEMGVVLESMSFYAEQGGQIFDTGSLQGRFGKFEVCNVQIYGGFVLHIGSLAGETSRLSVGDKVVYKVDYHRRSLIAPNHTCTHMLNFALRASKQKEAALEAALTEKEFVEEECKKKVDEAKKKEASLENDLANMWGCFHGPTLIDAVIHEIIGLIN
ncbi:hypothetical protein Ancab_008467 [Ancistrocladus abbreviatus]